MQKFKERREEILGIFSKARAELEQLNTEIDAQIAQNKEQIAALSAANTEMTALNWTTTIQPKHLLNSSNNKDNEKGNLFVFRTDNVHGFLQLSWGSPQC